MSTARRTRRNSGMRVHQHLLVYSLVIGCTWSCATGKQHVNVPDPLQPISTETPILSIYGIGDAGEDDPQSRAVVAHLAKTSGDDIQPGIIFFLGDNIYPAGLAPEGHEDHDAGVSLLVHQIGQLADYKDPVIFIPGNHDWNEFKPGGLAAIRRQSDFINHLGKTNVRFSPSNGCGDPVVMAPAPNINIIILDSQWWIQDWTKEPEMNAGCVVKTREQLMQQIKSVLDANPGEQFVFVMHHPMEAQGPHGGHYTFRDHMFPLSKVVKWLYVPLPVLGSIYPWYRTVIGHPQDLKHKAYKSLQTALYDVIGDRKDVIFLAGHDHSLQYIHKDNRHMVISGAGAKGNAIDDNPDLLYGHKAPGYVILDFYRNKTMVLTIIEIDAESGNGNVVFKRRME